MKKALGLLSLLFAPGFCLAANALIVEDGTPGIEADVLGNLSSKLVAHGFTVSTSVGLPGRLAGNQQVWDIRFNNTTPLTAADITAYTSYVASGGSLFVMGENVGFLTRDNSILTLISTLGGGNLTIVTPNNNETVQPPFTGPVALANITFLAAAGSVALGTGNPIAIDSGFAAAAIVWAPGRLSSAPAGTLMVVFDVNFLQAGADANSQALTNNMISFLAAPVTIPPIATPTLGQWALIGLSILLVGMGCRTLQKRMA